MHAYELTEHAGKTNLGKAQALEVYDACPKAMREEFDRWTKTMVPVPFILHDVKWKRICRTDDCDDVSTTRPDAERNADSVFAYYRKRIILGARFDDRSFACIDSFTDG